MDTITEGAAIEVTDALGRTFRKRALSPVDTSGRYPAVWACADQEWLNAQHEGRDPVPEPFPWPMTSVRVPAVA